ncbi:MAG: DMT family transporter [Atribacterota bacterium]
MDRYIPAIIALLAAISIAVQHIILRYLRLTDHHLVIVNYFSYTIGVLSLTTLLVQQSFQLPSPSDCLVLILLGGIGLFTQIALTKAYQLTAASLLSLYTYSQIIFGSVFGLLFFKEIPDIFSISTASIIISGYLNYRYKSND